MSVMQKGWKAIVNPFAKVMEEVHTNWEEEYNRKKRISAGNFQNLSYFSAVLTKPFTPLAFSFFFHKVLRWILPVLALPVLVISAIELLLWNFSPWPLLITLTLILVPVPLHYILHKLNLPLATLRRLSYFIYINIALLHGFFNYIKGIQSNVWTPTKRR
jgi:cellulose synthase/poly-beta-1,6-N-acetylglucosamine synthase-like glycosyltransferase